MEITKIDLTILRNNEHLNCINEVKQIIVEQTATALGLRLQKNILLIPDIFE